QPTPEEVAWARDQLLNPEQNVRLLAGKLQRLKRELGLSPHGVLQASRSYLDAKAIATLSYLHNGKLDYPARVLRYMQDPELHGLIYSRRAPARARFI
ncbi:MAG: helicase DnaB, partial [Synechococcus sp. cluster2_bin.44]|nr:helicase DnaB [Synechococcus sp. cluster2_bin.44]